MPFLRRLGYFLVGLAIGLIFLAFFLRKKTEETGTEFCYLPNCRVLKSIRSMPLNSELSWDLSPKDSLILQAVLEEGSVRFKESDPQAEPCKFYIIEGEYEGENLRLSLEHCESHSVLKTWELTRQD
jgi:hypothetical protein